MKKLLAIAVVLTSLFLGGCIAPSGYMTGTIGVGPQGGYGMNRGGYVNQPYYNSNNNNQYLNAIAERAVINGQQRAIIQMNHTQGESMMRGGRIPR